MAKGQKTGGRRAGTPNKITRDFRVLLAELGTADDGSDLHAERLHQLTTSKDEHVCIKALTLVMAYRHGKPTEHHEHTGPGGGPIAYRWQQ